MSRQIYRAEPGASLDRLLRALADRTRLRLLNLIGGNEVCVCYFVEALQTSQPKVSRHLAYLRRAGLVATRRQGTWMHYRMVPPSDPRAARILKEVLAALGEDREMRRDRDRLDSACCAPQKFVTLQSAPTPRPVAEPEHERRQR
ncbi:MAG TPA: metalloregulator ArsR/SmtB family transcription factor [Terriglobales bacterium]|jgi:ArsR family transcriptional regulator